MSVNFIWYLAKQNKNENNNTWENSRAQSTTLNMHSHLSTFKVANRIHNACAILCEIFSTVFHLAICKATNFRERLVFILFHFLFAFNFMVFRIIRVYFICNLDRIFVMFVLFFCLPRSHWTWNALWIFFRIAEISEKIRMFGIASHRFNRLIKNYRDTNKSNLD